MAEYTYSSSYTTGSSGRPFTLSHSVYPAALMSLSAGEMSSDSTSGRTSRGSGSHSPNLSSVPRSVRYNPIPVPSVARSGRERKRRASMQDDFSATTMNLPPLVPPRMRCKSYFHYAHIHPLARTPMPTHTRSLAHLHVHPHAYMRTCAHTCMHTRTFTHQWWRCRLWYVFISKVFIYFLFNLMVQS